MTTRREIIKTGAGLAAIIAAGRAPAAIVRSMIAARNAMLAGGAKLPYDAEVEYLKSTGTQWIDTTENADSELGYSMRFGINNYTSGKDQPFGVLKRNPIIRHHAGIIYANNVLTLNILLGTGTNYIVSRPAGTAGEVYDYEVDTINKTASIGDTSGSWSSISAFDTGLSFWLFGRHDSTASSNRPIAATVYFAKFYRAGVLVRDYQPVRYTNELGQSEGAMYDRANPTGGPLGNGLYPSSASNAPFTGSCIGPDK